MQEQIGNVSREMDTSGKKLKRNSSNKNPHNVTEKKDAFHALMNRISGRGSISDHGRLLGLGEGKWYC